MLIYSPSNSDIASSVLFGTSSWSFNRSGFVNGALKQYVILIIANNIAINSGIIKKVVPNSLISDLDFWTGVCSVLATIYEIGNTNLLGEDENILSSEVKVKKITKEEVEGIEGDIIKRTIEDEYEPEPEEVVGRLKQTEPLMIDGYPNKKITIDLVSSLISNILARIIFEERKINFV